MKRPSEYMIMTDGVTRHDYEKVLNKYIDYLEQCTLPIISAFEAKCLALYGRTNDRKVVLDENPKKLDLVFEWMFGQLDKEVREEAEALFWKRIEALANYREHTNKHL